MVECERVYKEYQAGTAGSSTLQFFQTRYSTVGGNNAKLSLPALLKSVLSLYYTGWKV